MAARRLLSSLNIHFRNNILKGKDVGSTSFYRCQLSSLAETLADYEGDVLHDGGKESEKEAALNRALSQLAVAGYFDKDSRLWLSRFFLSRYMHVVSTGSLKLDLALGIGGLPKGRIVEIYGKEASGKTTLALHIIMEAQKHGGRCAYLDVENAIDPALLDAMGIKPDKLLFARPDTAENTLSVVNTLASSGAIDVIVIDSVAALLPGTEIENSIASTYTDMLPCLMTRALRKIHTSLSQSQTVVIFVNQVRFDVRSNLGHGHICETTCGGSALKFHAAIRLRTSRCHLLHTSEKISGIRISVEVMKNKLAPIVKDELGPAMKSAALDIEFGKGINRATEVLELASSHGLISKEGQEFRIDEKYFENQEEATKYLTRDASVMNRLIRGLRMKLFGEE